MKYHAYLWVTESYFTHNLNIYHIMTPFVYELIGDPKPFSNNCINEDVGI